MVLQSATEEDLLKPLPGKSLAASLMHRLHYRGGTKTEPLRVGLADIKAYLGMKHIVHAWRGGLDLRSEMETLMVGGESAKQGFMDLTEIELVVPVRGQANLATKQEAWTRCQAAPQRGREN